MGKFSNTWSLMGDSFGVLKQDKELLWFPLVSGICCLLVVASFAIPIVGSESWRPPGEGASVEQQIGYYAMLFAFYFCNYFIITFFNAAVISCAMIRMEGGDPTVSDGFRAAFSRLHLIFGWALVSATVGLILRIIEDRSEKVGRFVAGLLGMAWTAVSFLVVPVLVVEQKSPQAALKESTRLLKKTWGEQLIGNFSFGLVFFVIAIPAYVLIGFGIYMFANGSTVPGAICIATGVVYFLLLALVQSILQSIFQAALYGHAHDGKIGEYFRSETLAQAFRTK